MCIRDRLQGLQTKVIVDITIVDGDLASACLLYTSNGHVILKWIGDFNIAADHGLQIFQLRANTDFLRIGIRYLPESEAAARRAGFLRRTKPP